MQFTDASTATQPNTNAGTQKSSSKGSGLMGTIIKGLTSAPEYFLNADIADPAKEVAAQVTHNGAAYNNAIRQAQQNLVVGNKVSRSLTTSAKNFGKDLVGNTAQLAATAVAPEGSGLKAAAIAGARGGALAGAGNAVSNNQNVLKGALTGGATGAVGGAVLPGVIGIASKVLGLGGKAATDASTAGAADAASATDNIGNGLISKLANRQTSKQAQQQLAKDGEPYNIVDKNIRQDTNMNGLFKTLHNTGMGTTPDQMQVFHDTTTSENGAASGTMRQILGNAGKIDVSGALASAKSAIQGEEGNLGTINPRSTGGAANGTLNEIRGILNSKMSPDGGAILGSRNASGAVVGNATIDNSVDANKVFDAIQSLESKAKSQPKTDVGVSRANVFRATKQALEKSLYEDGKVNQAVKEFKLAPEDESAIRSNVASKGGSNQLADHIITGINGAKSGPELRAFQEPAVRAGQLSDAYTKASGGAIAQTPKGSGIGTGAAIVAGQVGHALTHPVEGVPMLAALAGRKLAGSAEDLAGRAAQAIHAQNITPEAQQAVDQATTAGATPTLGNRLANSTTGKVLNTAANTVKTLAGRGASTANALSGGSPGSSGAGSATGSLAGAANAGATLPVSSGNQLSLNGQTLGNQQEQPTSEYPQQNMLEDIERDPKNASMYMALYKQLNPNTTLTTNQQDEVTGSQKAQTTLQDYYSQLTSAGGGKGVVGGTLEDIAGALGFGGTAAAARAVNTQRTDVASAVAASLSPTGRPTASITKQIAESLPSITDSKSVAEDKMTQLMQRINDGEFTAEQPLQTTTGQ